MLQYLEECEIAPPSAGEEHAVWQLVWTKQGIVAGRASGAVDVLDFDKLETKQSCTEEHSLGIVSLSQSADDRYLLTNSMDGAITLWQWTKEGRLEQAAQRASIKGVPCGPEPNEPYPVQAWVSALHPDAHVFAVSGENACVALFSAHPDTFGEHGQRLSFDTSYASYATCLAFNYEGDLLAMGTNTGVVFIWDIHTGEQVACLTEHAQPVRTVTFARPNVSYSDHMFVGSDDRTITVHDVQAIRSHVSETAVAALQGHRGWVLDVQAGGNGRVIASTCSDHVVRLWDLGTSPIECIMTQTQKTPIWGVAWHPDSMEGTKEDMGSSTLMAAGHRFITGSDDGHVRMYRSAGTGTRADEVV